MLFLELRLKTKEGIAKWKINEKKTVNLQMRKNEEKSNRRK